MRAALFKIYIIAIPLCLEEETTGDSCGEQQQAHPGIGGGILASEGESVYSSDDASGRGVSPEAG